MADYDRVLRITPKDSKDYSARGSAYFAKDDYKAAASGFGKALQLSPNNDPALGVSPGLGQPVRTLHYGTAKRRFG